MPFYQGKYSLWSTEDLKKELKVLRDQINEPGRRQIDKDTALRKLRQVMSVLRNRGI